MFKRNAEEDAESPRPETAEVLDSENPLPPTPGTAEPATTSVTPPAAEEPTPPKAAPADEVDIQSLLRRLDDVARAAGDSGGAALRRVADEVEEHAESLSASVTARQEAQRLLTLATEERDRASAAGAAIIEEARQIAARLTNEAQSHAADAMSEIQRWATGQRDSIAEVVSELTDTAQRDADTIRADAQETALEEARRTAEIYVARAAALATRDAERHRTQATEVLGRSAEAVSAAHATMHEFTATLATFVGTMSEHLDTLQEVVEQAEAGRDAATEAAPIAVDPAGWAAAGGTALEDDLVILPLDPFTTPETQQLVEEEPVDADTDADSAADESTDDESTEKDNTDDEGEQDEPAAEESDSDDPEQTDDEQPARSGPDAGAGFPEDDDRRSAPRSPQLPPPPAGRPLGSLFRDVERG